MTTAPRAAAVFAVAIATIAATGGAFAQVSDRDETSTALLTRWLPRSDDPADGLARRPREFLATHIAGGKLSPLVRLGQLAFRTPQLFGGEARRADLTCEICHPRGHTNVRFFAAPVSDRPGNVDVTKHLFNPAREDGLENPVNIPSLRGNAATAPYGRDGRFASVREFTRHVIVNEFMGREPAPWLLDALVAYQHQLSFLPASLPRGADGLLDGGAPAAALRGETLFLRASAKTGLSCATCHRPTSAFIDGLRHSVGSGGLFDTPTLLNIVHSAPYFHDGRYADLAGVVAHFDRVYGLAFKQSETEDLLRYLDVIGGGNQPVAPARLQAELADIEAFSELLPNLLETKQRGKIAFVANAIRHQLGLIHARLGEGTTAYRQRLANASRSLAVLGSHAETGDFTAATVAYEVYLAILTTLRHGTAEAERGSLYDGAATRRVTPSAFQ